MPTIPLHISALFIFLVFGVAFMMLIAVYIACKRVGLSAELRRNYFFAAVFIILIWLVFTLLITTGGLLNTFGNNWKVVFLMGPPFLFIGLLMFSKMFSRLLQPIDNFWFIYLQSYRLLREFILLLLFRYGVIPAGIAFGGRNLDALIGISAPFIAFYCFKKLKWFKPIALVWNVAGLALIANMLVTLILPVATDAGNFSETNFMFSFPFVWIPSFLAPIGVLSHFISIKKLLQSENGVSGK